MATITVQDAPPAEAAGDDAIESLVPARIDRLGWSKFHTRMVIALGVAWILVGLGGLLGRDDLPTGRGSRGVAVRAPGRQMGPAQTLHDHPRCLPHRWGLV